MTAIEIVKRDKLRKLLLEETEPVLRGILYSCVPHVRHFLADEIAMYATNAMVDQLLESFSVNSE